MTQAQETINQLCNRLDALAAGNHYRPYGDGYYVFSDGRVANKNGKILKPLPNFGYLRVSIKVNGKKKYCRIHRLVAESFIPNPQNKPFVCHIDGNSTNNNVTNLYWGTASENSLDSVRHGTSSAAQNGRKSAHKISGASHWNAQLNHSDVINIRALSKDGLSSAEIARRYKCHRTSISRIVNGSAWPAPQPNPPVTE